MMLQNQLPCKVTEADHFHETTKSGSLNRQKDYLPVFAFLVVVIIVLFSKALE